MAVAELDPVSYKVAKPTGAEAPQTPDAEPGKSPHSAGMAEEEFRQKEQVARDIEAHAADFQARTGMTPKWCFRLFLLSLALKIIGGSWMAMVYLEYVRYYVINDINVLTAIETATESPLSLIKAFWFPFWGVAADRVSRKKLLVITSFTSCAGAWLLSVVPSVPVFVGTRCLSLVADFQGPVRHALLRDLFSASEWERVAGGITGINSRIAIFGTLVAAVGVGIGMGLLKLGEAGVIGLDNEYSLRKDLCKDERHCVTPGRFSWDEAWAVDGLLRLLMLMGCTAFTMEAFLVLLFMPETLKTPKDATLAAYFARSWRQMRTPWNNMRVFATTQLRELMLIRFIFFIVAGGGTSIFLTWYRRHEDHLNTLKMYSMGVGAGVVGFLTLLAVSRIVHRFGDLRGLWLSSTILLISYAIGVALLPEAQWYLAYALFPVLGGPSATLSTFTPDLVRKLIPADVQGTFETAKSFLFDFQRAFFVWPWLGLLVASKDWPYPLDALPIWVAALLGSIALLLIIRQLPLDPKASIMEGRALDPFMKTAYAKSRWYRRHGGHPPRCDPSSQGGGGALADFNNRVKAAEGTTKMGLILKSAEDSTLSAQLEFVAQVLPKVRSMSVVLAFLDCDDLFDAGAGGSRQGSFAWEDRRVAQEVPLPDLPTEAGSDGSPGLAAEPLPEGSGGSRGSDAGTRDIASGAQQQEEEEERQQPPQQQQ